MVLPTDSKVVVCRDFEPTSGYGHSPNYKREDDVWRRPTLAGGLFADKLAERTEDLPDSVLEVVVRLFSEGLPAKLAFSRWKRPHNRQTS